MFNSSKGKIYRTFKLDFGCEKYLEKLPQKIRAILLKFRTTNHRLPVENGRWINMPSAFLVVLDKIISSDEECSVPKLFEFGMI